MKELKDIRGNILKPNDKIVFEQYSHLNIGVFSHVAESTIVILTEPNGYFLRQINHSLVHKKVYKID